MTSAHPSPSDILKGMVSRSRGIIYDRARLPHGAAEDVSLFAVPLRRIDPYTATRKTLSDTNMHIGGMLPAPRCIVAKRVGFLVPRIAGLTGLGLSGSWDLRVDDKIYVDGPLALDTGWAWRTPLDAPSDDEVKGLREIGPLYIAPQRLFEVRIRLDNPSVPVDFWCVIEGDIDSSVW